ncbi:MAG: DNA photolyase [Proteobacteria bacterium]|nr:DNA photolyase [Pseudomonadota bacterium]
MSERRKRPDNLKITKLFMDENAIDFPAAKLMLQRYNMPYETVGSQDKVYEFISGSENPIQQAKETLYITKNRGSFIKECPGTSYYTCCGYKILHIGTFCSMDCSYCILQSYFHPPVLQFFVNHEDLIKEIDTLFKKEAVSRVGTGEFTDSMIWERWTDLSTILIPEFSKQARAVLELKTKTTDIDLLKGLCHNKKTIAAWSLNTERIIKEQERRTSSLTARLKAAAACESWGYPVAFHFDPVILYDGCEEEYKKVIRSIFSYVSPGNIVWISIGTFRFMPALKSIIQNRFPDSKIPYGEFVAGLDGKMRYFKPLRIGFYQKMVAWIKEIAPDVLVYFCMEDDEVWEKAAGFVPKDRGGLAAMLDKSAILHCGLKVF